MVRGARETSGQRAGGLSMGPGPEPGIGIRWSDVGIARPQTVQATVNPEDLLVKQGHTMEKKLLSQGWGLATNANIAAARLGGAPVVLVSSMMHPMRRMPVRDWGPVTWRPDKHHQKQVEPQNACSKFLYAQTDKTLN